MIGKLREDFLLAETIGSNIVPAEQLNEAVTLILSEKHAVETEALLRGHYEERLTALKPTVERLLAEKAPARKQLIDKLVAEVRLGERRTENRME